MVLLADMWTILKIGHTAVEMPSLLVVLLVMGHLFR